MTVWEILLVCMFRAYIAFLRKLCVSVIPVSIEYMQYLFTKFYKLILEEFIRLENIL